MKVKENILHIEYSSTKDIPEYIDDIANQYEGKIKNRLGFNFPMSFALSYTKSKNKKVFNILNQFHINEKANYVIVYKKGDIQTKKHELCHAKFALDPLYKESVFKLWNSFSDTYRKNVRNLLKQMKYPDKDEILIDEFQAYYYTEKKGFFGKEK